MELNGKRVIEGKKEAIRASISISKQRVRKFRKENENSKRAIKKNQRQIGKLQRAIDREAHMIEKPKRFLKYRRAFEVKKLQELQENREMIELSLDVRRRQVKILKNL